MWSLSNPAFLLISIVIPFLVWYAYLRKGRGCAVSFSYSTWKGPRFSPPATGVAIVRGLAVFFTAAGMLFLVIALAGPVLVETEKIFLSRGIDMVIALDESPSMSAPDFKPENRFEAAKETIEHFVRARENDQIGLVTFGSQASLRVPPTLDYGFLLRTLDSLSIMELGEGTAIGMGIAVSALHLRSSKTKDKVIILLTDGVNNEGSVSPLDATASAYRMGIRIYTIGIGGEEKLEWTFTDPNTGTPYTGRSGEFDEALLKTVAEMSGGRYFYAGEPGVLKRVFGEIDSLETSQLRAKKTARHTEVHDFFILVGLVLICASYVIRSTVSREIL